MQFLAPQPVGTSSCALDDLDSTVTRSPIGLCILTAITFSGSLSRVFDLDLSYSHGAPAHSKTEAKLCRWHQPIDIVAAVSLVDLVAPFDRNH